jgi:ATP-dependent exoDNAse (exonuclease V) beta subunit
VIYVACTRAIKHLHLLFKQADKDPAGNSLLAALWPTLKVELEDPAPECQITRHAGQADLSSTSIDEGASTESDIDNSHRFQWRLAPDWSRPACHRPTQQAVLGVKQLIQDDLSLPAETSPDNRYMDDGPLGSESGSKPDSEPSDVRKTGILFHRTLQYLVADGLECWDTNRIAQQKQLWQRQTQELAFTDPDQAIDTLISALTNCLDDADNAWIFDRHLEDSATELALGYIDHQGKTRTAVVDRTFILNGERWIIDYKLSKRDGSLALDDFIALQKQQYSPQLKHYARLFEQISSGSSKTLAQPIKTALYFPLYSRLEIIELNN